MNITKYNMSCFNIIIVFYVYTIKNNDNNMVLVNLIY